MAGESDQTLRRKKRLFLKTLAETGAIFKAAKRCKLSLGRIRRMRQSSPKFNEKVELAMLAYVEKLERAADERGVDGVDEPVFYEGEEVATKKKYSDSLLMFRLRGLAPEKYADRKVVSGQIDHKVTVYIPDNQRDRAAALPPPTEEPITVEGEFEEVEA